MQNTPKDKNRLDQVIVRLPAKNLAEGSVSTVGIPDAERALVQHMALIETLERSGVNVTTLAADSSFPDGSFIRDMAVIAGRLAVIGNFDDEHPRQGEQQKAASALAGTHFLKFISAPGRLDARDVLKIDDRFYVGLSDNTNHEGASQLGFFLKEFGYDLNVVEFDLDEEMHLGQAATYIGANTLLIRDAIARHFAFLEFEKITVPEEEENAASCLLVNGTLLMPAGYPQVREKLKEKAVPVVELNISEFEKMGGSLSALVLALPYQEKGSIALPSATLKIKAA